MNQEKILKEEEISKKEDVTTDNNFNKKKRGKKISNHLIKKEMQLKRGVN